jgi:hypothetical protein
MAAIDINRVAATAIATVIGEDHPRRRSTSGGRAVAAGAAVAAAALAARRSQIPISGVVRRSTSVLSALVNLDEFRDALRDRLTEAGLLDLDDAPSAQGRRATRGEHDSAAAEDEEAAEDEDEDEDEWAEEDEEGDYDWDQAESEWDERLSDDSAGRQSPTDRPPEPPRKGRSPQDRTRRRD